jgi:hypothetical protein
MGSQEDHQRKSLRMQGFDYAQDGAYFVTIDTYERAIMFGEIVYGQIRLNGAGRIVRQAWLALAGRPYGEHLCIINQRKFVSLKGKIPWVIVDISFWVGF